MKENDAVRIIRARQVSASKPGFRDDDFRLGLVIEGGGMRGVVSGAMTAALENLGLRDCFDAVYGASAGAMAGAYFIAGSARAGATIYYEHINNKHFVNPWRLLSTRPILNLDFLVYDVFKYRVPLNCQAIISSKGQLNIVMTEVKSGGKKVLNVFSDESHVLLALKASASNPMISGHPVEIDGVGYWDAILTESIPVQTAIDDGCTHVVILRSRAKNEIRSEIGLIERFLAKRIIRSESEAAYNAYLGKSESYKTELKLVESLGEKCLSISPTGRAKVSQTSSNRQVLLGAAIDGYHSVLKALNEEAIEVSPMIGHY